MITLSNGKTFTFKVKIVVQIPLNIKAMEHQTFVVKERVFVFDHEGHLL